MSDVNLEFVDQRFMAFFGPSSSGKPTAMKMIAELG